VGVDQVDQFPAHLTEQHHPRHIEHLGRGDPEATLEIACNAQLLEHRTDLRAATVHHHRFDAAVAQEHHVGSEGGLEGVVGHGVAAVLDDDDLAVQLLEPRQRRGEHLGLDAALEGLAHEL
jgi:hypothetical protein